MGCESISDIDRAVATILDPDFKNQITTGMIDFQLKSGFTKAEVTLLPPDPANNKSFVTKGKIIYSPSELLGQVKIAFL